MTFDHISNALNINGNQNITKLRMSVDQKASVNGHDRPSRLDARAQSRDIRIPSNERSIDALQITDADEDDVSTFDMDFFPVEAAEQVRGRQNLKKVHVFGQAENHRDEDLQSEEASLEEEGLERAHRRTAGLPIIQKSVRPFYSRLALRLSQILAELSTIFPDCWLLVLLTPCNAGCAHPCPFLSSIASPTFSFRLQPRSLCRLRLLYPRTPLLRLGSKAYSIL
jgi:hypothetical protein